MNVDSVVKFHELFFGQFDLSLLNHPVGIIIFTDLIKVVEAVISIICFYKSCFRFELYVVSDSIGSSIEAHNLLLGHNILGVLDEELAPKQGGEPPEALILLLGIKSFIILDELLHLIPDGAIIQRECIFVLLFLLVLFELRFSRLH